MAGTDRGRSAGDLATENTNIPPASQVAIRECAESAEGNPQIRQRNPGRSYLPVVSDGNGCYRDEVVIMDGLDA
jgi:hypothetical protein